MLPESGEAALCFDDMNYRNKETKRHMKPGIEVTRASAVPYGRAFIGAVFPGTMCLANFRGRFATFRVKEREVAKPSVAQKPWRSGAKRGRV